MIHPRFPVPGRIAVALGLIASASATARAETDPACRDEAILERLMACSAEAQAYDHGAWRLFRANVCLANYEVPAVVEKTFCHLTHDLGIDVAALELDDAGTAVVEGDFEGRTVTVTFRVPDEAFAVAAGYDAAADVEIDGLTKSRIWWSGSDPEATRGFMIDGPTPWEVGRPEETAVYIRWDRTTPVQEVEYLYGRWDAGDGWLAGGADDVGMTVAGNYGSMTLDVDTGLVPDLQVVRLGRELTGEAPPEGEFGGAEAPPAPEPAPLSCYRQRMYGRLDGGYVYAFNNSDRDEPFWTDLDRHPGEGDDQTRMGPGELLVDDPTYANGHNEGTSEDFLTAVVDPATGDVVADGPGDFAWSCDDIYESGLFTVAATVVDFDATPEGVFGSP
ncbi:hypothetical protein L6R50_04210 [Myxococcota bacterium]|nr:hypothetical protein [Myxococcota bacterium]